MARGRRHTHEEMVHVLRQVDADTARGTKTQLACYAAGISEQTYYRWYREYVNLTIDQANCLKALQGCLIQSTKMLSELDRLRKRACDSVAERPGAEAP